MKSDSNNRSKNGSLLYMNLREYYLIISKVMLFFSYSKRKSFDGINESENI